MVKNMKDFHFLVNSLFGSRQAKKADSMYMSLFIWFLISFFLLIVTAISQAETIRDREGNAVGDYYQNSKKGYWWYEDPLKEEKKEKKQEKRAEKERVLPSLKDYSYEQLWGMHPDDFQALLMDFQKKAVQNPTEDNIVEYKTVEDIARRKALAFANASQFVTQKYPELSLAKDYPTAIPGRNAITRQMMDEITAEIHNAQNDFALLYFYSPTCPYCHEQDGILKYFVDKYNWQIKKINKDTDIRSLKFNVEMVPALILIHRNSPDYIPISTGVASMQDIEERLYRGIRWLKNQTDITNWNTYDFQKGGGFDTRKYLKK